MSSDLPKCDSCGKTAMDVCGVVLFLPDKQITLGFCGECYGVLDILDSIEAELHKAGVKR